MHRFRLKMCVAPAPCGISPVCACQFARQGLKPTGGRASDRPNRISTEMDTLPCVFRLSNRAACSYNGRAHYDRGDNDRADGQRADYVT